MEHRPGGLGVEAMSLFALDPGISVGVACCAVIGADNINTFSHAVVGEDLILCSAYGDKLTGRDQSAQITHIEIQSDIRYVVTAAVDHSADRILVGAEGAGGHRQLDALVYRRRLQFRRRNYPYRQ